jgi:hypothetical protein
MTDPVKEQILARLRKLDQFDVKWVDDDGVLVMAVSDIIDLIESMTFPQPRLTRESTRSSCHQRLDALAYKFNYDDDASQWWTEAFLSRFIDAILADSPEVGET